MAVDRPQLLAVTGKAAAPRTAPGRGSGGGQALSCVLSVIVTSSAPRELLGLCPEQSSHEAQAVQTVQ